MIRMGKTSRHIRNEMSRNVRKPTMWILTSYDTNQAVQLLEMARGLKFCIQQVEGLYYPSSENKDADQLSAKLICVFVFAYAQRWFSHDAAQIQFLPFLNCVNRMPLNFECKYLHTIKEAIETVKVLKEASKTENDNTISEYTVLYVAVNMPGHAILKHIFLKVRSR